MLRISRLVLAVTLLAGCAGRNASEEEQESTVRSDVSTGSCGVERWSIKTGTDSAVTQVNMTPQDTTIASMRAIPAPSTLGQNSPRFTFAGSAEIQVFRLTNVTFTQYKLESDSDYHMILQDAAGSTMIAEIPDPACVTSGPWVSAITASRAAFDARFTASTSFQTANVPVTITGAGFFDLLHGQTGVAPNGIELHAVLSVCFGTNCGGTVTPDFSLSASPAGVSGSGSSTITVTPSGGFASSVVLTASGVPAGASATLNPTSVSSSGSSTLTLAPGTAAAGTYAITVTGTGGAKTHTATVSWTIAATGGGGALTNGDFESGLTGWTATGTTSSSTTAHTGTHSAMVGSTSPGGDSSLAQTFTLPATATSLSFWYQVHCPDTITFDWASATLKDNTSGTTTTMLPNTCTNGGVWVQASATVTGGHSVTLTLSNHDDAAAGDATFTLYDTVAITTGGGGDTTPPTTSVTAPASGATVSGTVTVTATATDNVGVTRIELYADGVLLGTGTTSPASASWNTTAVANGSHTLTSKAFDAAGNVGTSAAVTVTVSNSTTVTNPFVNPGFETGTLSGWTATGVAAARAFPHTGSFSGSLGSSTPSANSSLSQTVTMPAGATTLSFWYRIFCNDTIQFDWASATLRDNTTGTTVTALPNTCTNNNTYLQASVNVTSMRGHSVTLTLSNHDDGATGDALFTDYDDVNVQ